jgi:hypothetical protein
MSKPKAKKPSAANAGRLAGITAGSYVVGMMSVVFRPILWLVGLLFGFLQVAALCSAVVLFVHWVLTRFQR